jgi:hypothetical protein
LKTKTKELALTKRQRGRIFFTITLLTIGLLIAILMPRFSRRILMYRTPGYDDYKLFDNREIQTGTVVPWSILPPSSRIPLTSKQKLYLAAGRTFSYVVVHHDQIVQEYYSPEAGVKFRANSFNLTQGLLSILVGCAIQDSDIRSVDQPVSDFYPEFYEKMNQGITIRNLLEMTSGLQPAQHLIKRWPFSLQAYYAKDLDQRILKMKPSEPPGETWHFTSANAQLLAMVLERATGMRVSDYLDKKLWKPLGCAEPALWSVDDAGNIKAFCCLFASARDLARIGQFMLNEGSLNGRQIVSRAYLRNMITPVEGLHNAAGKEIKDWGWYWWITHYRGRQVIFSRGQMGQYLIIVPRESLVIVRQGELGSPDFTRINNPELYQLLDIAFQTSGIIL